MDDAVVGLLNGRAADRGKPGKAAKPSGTPMSDGAGLKSLFRDIAASKKKGVKNG